MNFKLGPEFSHAYRSTLEHRRPGELHPQQAQSIGKLIEREFHRADSVAGFAIENCLHELMMLLSGSAPRIDCNPPRWLGHVKEYLAASFEQELSLERLSQLIDRHPTHISREFTRHYRKTMSRFVRERRIVRAMRLLQEADLPLADIALQCGFFDQSHFTKCFREFVGVTPSAYRIQNRSQSRSQ